MPTRFLGETVGFHQHVQDRLALLRVLSMLEVHKLLFLFAPRGGEPVTTLLVKSGRREGIMPDLHSKWEPKSRSPSDVEIGGQVLPHGDWGCTTLTPGSAA